MWYLWFEANDEALVAVRSLAIYTQRQMKQ